MLIHNTQSEQAFISCNSKHYGLEMMKTHKWQFQKISDNIDQKIRFMKRMHLSLLSVFGWGSFCMIYCLNVA